MLYVLSLRARDYRTRKIMDIISLLCAIVFVSALVYHLDPLLTLMLPLVCSSFGSFVFYEQLELAS